jgi:hypothetical protein
LRSRHEAMSNSLECDLRDDAIVDRRPCKRVAHPRARPDNDGGER